MTSGGKPRADTVHRRTFPDSTLWLATAMTFVVVIRTSLLSVQFNIAFNFVSPDIPPFSLLSRKQFNSRQVAHKRNDFLPYLIRFFTVLFNGAYNKLMYISLTSFRMTFCRKEAYFSISSGPKAQPIKPCRRLSILFQPDEANCFIRKSPLSNELHSLIKHWKGRPQKQGAVPFRNVFYRKLCQFFYPHCCVMANR